MLSLTRFFRIYSPPEDLKLPPVSLVLHAEHGNCVGPHASYDFHVLGGPASSRAYSIGELGAARSYLETAAEVRVPVPFLKTQAYAYVENARDLGSIADLPGRPREYFSRLGQGTSLGVGVKLGVMRAEIARDCNKDAATWFMFFGERF
jgi:hypothetical protein